MAKLTRLISCYIYLNWHANLEISPKVLSPDYVWPYNEYIGGV